MSFEIKEDDPKYTKIAYVSKDIYYGNNKLKFGERNEPEDDQSSGWFFFSDELFTRGNFTAADFVGISYIEVCYRSYSFLLLIYDFPVGCDIQIAHSRYDRKRLTVFDNESRLEIDLKKYLQLPIGTPLSQALLPIPPSKGFFESLFGKTRK